MQRMLLHPATVRTSVVVVVIVCNHDVAIKTNPDGVRVAHFSSREDRRFEDLVRSAR